MLRFLVPSTASTARLTIIHFPWMAGEETLFRNVSSAHHGRAKSLPSRLCESNVFPNAARTRSRQRRLLPSILVAKLAVTGHSERKTDVVKNQKECSLSPFAAECAVHSVHQQGK